MATGGATGFVLHIDDELINKLNTADQKIQDLAKHSEDTRDRVIAAFKKMGDDGAQYLIQKLQDVQQRIEAISGKEIKVNVTGLDNAGTSAAASAEQVNKLLDATIKLADANASLIEKAQKQKIASDNSEKAQIEADKKIIKSSDARMRQVTANLSKEDEARRASLEKQGISQTNRIMSDVTAYNYYASQLRELNGQMDALVKSTKAYEEVQSRIKSGKGGIASQQDKKYYQENIKAIDSIKKQIEYYQKLQQQVVNTYNSSKTNEQSFDQIRSSNIKRYLEMLNAENVQRGLIFQRMREYYSEEARLAEQNANAQKNRFLEVKRFSSQARTYEEERQAVKALIAVRNTLDQQDIFFKVKRDELNKEIQRHTLSLKQQGMTEQQVAEMAQQAADKKEKAAQRAQRAVERETAAYQKRQQLIKDKEYS